MKNKRELRRYLLASPVVGATDFGVYFLSQLFLPVAVAKAASYICAGITGYLISKYWTFSAPKKCYREMGRYWIGEIALLEYNVISNHVMLHFWPRGVLPALAVASLSTAVLSYVLKKTWIFRSREK